MRCAQSAEPFELEKDGIYRCGGFRRFDWQSHGFGTRTASPRADVTLRQVHSDRIWNAVGLTDRQHEGDGLISDQAGLHIGVRTADCVPILILDSRTHLVAAVHSGWRGSAAGIVRRTIIRMCQEFATEAGDVYAAIGPCIRECCYTVSHDVAVRFAPQFPEWGTMTGNRNIDLAEANRRQMISEGVPSGQIFDSGLCTACSADTLFSYRREPANPGRMIAAICRLA